MKRYSPEINCQYGRVYEDENGDLVLHEDAAARIAEQEAERGMFAKQWALADRALVGRDVRIAELETELATLRAENAHLKRALELVDALRNKERNLPL